MYEATLDPRQKPTLPDEGPFGACDWGGCDYQAADWRWCDELKCWLPVCNAHRKPE